MATPDTDQTVFLRDSSGLVKSIGKWGAILFGVHCISLSSSGFIPFSWVASNWPGADIAGLLIVSMGVSLIHGYTFAAIGASIPRSGADYILASRFLNPIVAFVGSWTLVIFSGVVVGGLLAFIPKSAIPALLQPMAIIFKNPSYSAIAIYASTPGGTVIIGTGALLITFALMLLPTRIILKTLSIGLILGVIAWLIIYFSLWSGSGPDAFKNAWNTFVGPTSSFGSYDARLSLAQRAGMTTQHGPYIMTLAGLIMGFWIFYGYYIPTFFAGEVRKANSGWTLVTASWASIIIAGSIFIIGALLLERLVPQQWIAAEGYIANNPEAVTAAAGKPVPGFPWITFYAAILKPNIYLVGFVAFAWIFTLINLAQTYFFYASRIIFAWSFDRIIPKRFAHVSAKTNSPVYSILAIAVLAEIGLIDAAYSGPLNTQLTFAFFAVITQIVSVIAIIIFPFKARREFNVLPGFVRYKIAHKIPVITVVSSVTLIYLVWMIVASFLYPAVGIASPSRTLSLLFILIVSGLVVFLCAKWYRNKYDKIDISKIYQRVPPA
jgi:amino acid transporter